MQPYHRCRFSRLLLIVLLVLRRRVPYRLLLHTLRVRPVLLVSVLYAMIPTINTNIGASRTVKQYTLIKVFLGHPDVHCSGLEQTILLGVRAYLMPSPPRNAGRT